MSKIAYADPPYFGCCRLYGHRHEEPYGCWDDVETHRTLIESLAEYDSWAMSATSNSLRSILPLCPEEVRIACWFKPLVFFKPGQNPCYSWEPVIFRTPNRKCRKTPTKRDAVLTNEVCVANVTFGKGLVGAKPPDFCYWLFELLGMKPNDEFHDLFPGTGGVTRAWEKWSHRKRTNLVVTGPLFGDAL